MGNFTPIIFGLLCVSCCLSYRYFYQSQLRTWDEAQQYCRQHYTDLATFDSEDDITDLQRPPGLGWAWIGLREEPDVWKYMGNTSMSWRWSSTGQTSQTGFSNWELMEPNNLLGEYCVRLVSNKAWVDAECSDHQDCICINGTGENTTYVYVRVSQTWTESQAYCRQHYTDLVTIESQEVNTKVAALLPWMATAWIGLYRVPFAWSDQSTGTFRNWMPGQPDVILHNEFCAFENELHKWEDLNCGIKVGSICYKPDWKTRKTTFRNIIKSNSNLTEQFIFQQIEQQLTELLSENRTDVTLQLKMELKKINLPPPACYV